MVQENLKQENTEKEENFAEMLQENLSDNDVLEPGQMVETEIVKIAGEWIFLYLGGKSEGYLDAKELTNKEGKLSVKEGDKIKAYFMSSQGGEMHFTTKISGDKAGHAVLQKAYENGIPVEGFVEKEIKGGYEVKIGSSRAFCPYSQMGLERISPERYLGEHISFKITEFGEKGRNIVLSNRAILEEKQREQIDILKQTLEEGARIRGVIKSLQDFGAFVDIGGVQALLPISEVSRSRVEDIKKELKVGQEIEAAILKLDWDNERISISIKEIQPDPWDNVARNYPEGTRHSGEIVRLTNFGAFVTLEPGVDGLIHISDLGGGTRIKHPREVVSKGQTIEVQVGKVDPEKKRISLTPVALSHEEETQKQYTDEKSDTYKPMGHLADLLKGKE